MTSIGSTGTCRARHRHGPSVRRIGRGHDGGLRPGGGGAVAVSVRLPRSGIGEWVAALDLDAVAVGFVCSAFIAPLNLLVVKAFTAYDLLTAVLFVALLFGT